MTSSIKIDESQLFNFQVFMPLRSTTRSAFLFCLLGLFGSSAQAQIVISNLTTARLGTDTVSTAGYWATLFTTSSSGSLTVDAVTLKMSAASNTSGNFQVSIFSGGGTGSGPTTVVATLSGN